MRTIRIEKEFQIPGTEVVVEAGDVIKINEADQPEEYFFKYNLPPTYNTGIVVDGDYINNDLKKPRKLSSSKSGAARNVKTDVYGYEWIHRNSDGSVCFKIRTKSLLTGAIFSLA
jgi:hypothetical protein